jgi:tetratricopeptide (TPR) repeat protein
LTVNTIEQLYHKIIELARSGAAEDVYLACDLCMQLPPADAANTAVVSSAAIETAVALERIGDLQRAADLYHRLSSDSATVASIRANATFRLGAILGHMGLTEESLAKLEAAGSQCDDLLVQRTALYHLASSLAVRGRFEAACDHLERLVSLPGDEPSELAARLKLIHCRARAGRSVGEIPDGVSTLSPLEAAAWMEAAFSLERTLGEELSAAMQERFTCAAAMTDAVRGQALWHLALGTLSAHPNDAPALTARLLQYEGADSLAPMLWAKAIECLAHKPDLSPDEIQTIWDRMPERCSSDLAGALMLAAFNLEQRGHLAAARCAYERLVSAEHLPDHVLTNAHFRLGVTLDSLGEWSAAVAHYTRASQQTAVSDPIRTEARFRLAQALQMEEDFNGAADLFRILREDVSLPEGKRAHARLQYGICLLRAGHIEAALTEIDACRTGTHGETSLAAEVALAEIYEAGRDTKRARECYQRVLHHPEAHPMERTAALTRLRRLGR